GPPKADRNFRKTARLPPRRAVGYNQPSRDTYPRSRPMGPITSHIGRLKDGSRSAFGVLFGRFLSGVRRDAERLLARGRAGLDRPEDVAQGVFFALGREVTSRRRRLFEGLRDGASLEAALSLLTRQQVRRARRYDRQAMRGAGQTVPLPSGGAG